MLSTSFIVARQPKAARKESFSRHSVNSLGTAQYGQEMAGDWTKRGRETISHGHESIGDWTGRGRETVSHAGERRQGRTGREVGVTSPSTEASLKKLGRSLSMSKRRDIDIPEFSASGAKSGRSVSHTRDPQQNGRQPTWDSHYQDRSKECFNNPRMEGLEEGATKFGYKYSSPLYGTIGSDASSIYAIQSRPLPQPGTAEAERRKEEKSLFENIERFTSLDRANIGINNLQIAQVNHAMHDGSTLKGTRSRIPVYKPQTGDVRMGQRAVTQMEISRTYEDPSTLGHSPTDSGDTLVRKGLMWVQQDKLFSRWKERFIILTTGYLQIFKKGATRFSDMGTFINKIKLSCIDSMALEDKRGYLTLVLTTSYPQEGKLLVRKTEGIKDWHDSLASSCSKEREKRARQPVDAFWNRKQLSESCGFENWISARDILGNKYNLEESPCSSIGRPYRALNNSQLNESKRAENLYSDTYESGVTNTNTPDLPAASPWSTMSYRPNIQTKTNISPVRLHQAMFSPPRNLGKTQRERY